MPPLHIKLGLIENFVKAFANQNSNGFEFLCKKFSKLSPAKLKESLLIHRFENFLKTQSSKKH